MSLKHIPLNRNNFIRFYDVATPVLDDTDYIGGFVNGYQYRWKSHCSYLPVVVLDTLVFYTNFDAPITGTFGIVQDGAIVSDANLFVLNTTLVGDNNHEIVLTIPVTNTQERRVFSIAIISGGVPTFISNPLMVLQKTEKNLNNTHLLSFRHNNNVFDYEWASLELIDPDYIVRVPLSVLEYSYPKDDSVYKSATSGRPRRTRAVISKAYNIEAYYVDEDTHDAMNYALHAQKVSINGNEIVLDGQYEVAFNRLMNIQKGTASVLVKDYGARLDTCVTIVT